MSLYAGLGLGIEEAPKKAVAASAEGAGTLSAADKPKKVTSSWGSGQAMIATQLQRKRAADKAAREALAAKKAKGATATVAKGTTVTVVKKSEVAAAMAVESSKAAEPFFQAAEVEIRDQYDPFRPNDFEQVKVRKQQEEEDTQRRDEEKKRRSARNDRSFAAFAPPMELTAAGASAPRPSSPSPPPVPAFGSEKAAAPPPPPSRESLQVSGEEAFARRGAPPSRESLQVSGEEAFARRGAPPSRESLQVSGEEAFRRRGAPAGSQAPAGSGVGAGAQANFGSKMLQKFGWKKGQGLGKDGQGMNKPLAVQRGKIVDKSTPKKQPDTIVLLKNMVGPGEVDEELQPETAEECSRFGEVKRCIVYECPRGSVPPEEAVRIFVQFLSADSAKKCQEKMHGRFFGARRVHAGFFDVAKFNKYELGPS